MSQPARPPNVIVMMSDEQRWDSLGCNGNGAASTPNLDALAARGASLDHCYAAYPLCCPSRMSLWTGLMPHDHRGWGNWRWLREDLRDRGLVQPFAHAGYHTIYNGKWHVPGTTPARMGFADVEAVPAVLDGHDRGRYIEDYRAYATELGYELAPGHIENLTPRDVAQLDRPGAAPYGTAEIPAEHFLETWQTTRFLEQLDRRPADQPFFAVCSWNAPHFPMIVPAPYDRLIDPDAIELPPNFRAGLDGKPPEVTGSAYREPDWPEAEWRRLIAHYLGFCALVDAQVGRVLEALDAGGLRDDTIVVFTADHGDMLGAHGLNKKGYPLHYEEALRVPMVIAGPGVEPGRRVDGLVSLMDLVPTIAALCGVDPGGDHDGVPFAAALAGTDSAGGRDHVISESFQIGGKEGGHGDAVDPAAFDLDRDGINVSIRTGQYRYIWRLHDHDELYDLDADPWELDNIAARATCAGTMHEFREVIAASLEDALPQVATVIRGAKGETDRGTRRHSELGASSGADGKDLTG
jgi:arylsulfatase A-like enzyme